MGTRLAAERLGKLVHRNEKTWSGTLRGNPDASEGMSAPSEPYTRTARSWPWGASAHQNKGDCFGGFPCGTLLPGSAASGSVQPAGGGAVIAIVLVICMVGAIVKSPLGIFSSGGDQGGQRGQTIPAVVWEINLEYDAKIEPLKTGASY